jgi:homoserine acetyltransferase
MADPDWQQGDYYGTRQGARSRARRRPHGRAHHLSVRRSLTEKFGRRLQDRQAKTFGFDADFQVESYLRHQGIAFTDRFDANSYLYITRAMSYFDLAEEHGGKLAEAFAGTRNARFCLVSFDTDWLYPTESSHDRPRAQCGGRAGQLRGAGRAVRARQLPARRARARPGDRGFLGHERSLRPDLAGDRAERRAGQQACWTSAAATAR